LNYIEKIFHVQQLALELWLSDTEVFLLSLVEAI